jgi:hypothetical protein
MKKKMIFMPFIVIGFIALAGLVVMELWNWLMPAIFGLGLISFWQSLGLIILSKILFGGLRWGSGGCCGYGHKGHYWKHKFKHKYANMSEEERERWKKNWEHCSSETKKAKTTEVSASGDSSEASADDE